MRLFLIRHGETEHNVAGLLAGVSDSRLTNHGVLQAQRLGQHLTHERALRFTHIYASDLQRAYMTAEALQRNQATRWPVGRNYEVVRLALLREQDFGSLELTPWESRRAANAPGLASHLKPDRANFTPQETAESMRRRAQEFLDDYLFPVLAGATADRSTPDLDCIAVVSHGLFLLVLWQTMLSQMATSQFTLGPGVDGPNFGRSLQFLPAWSNTGHLELVIGRPERSTMTTTTTTTTSTVTAQREQPTGAPANGQGDSEAYTVTVSTVNGRDHLQGLTRTRGGLGSSPFDTRQRSLCSFFSRPKQ